MNVLGIESTCDETAMAIVNEKKEILAEIIVSQINIHKEFGGVVPEIASRSHLDVIDLVFINLLKKANLKVEDLDVIAASTGPGLIGGVVVGTMFAKTLSSILKKPFIAVNHLEAHALTSRINNDVNFPFLLLLLSGGHCQVLEVNGIGKYKKLGETIDDALGECFDKVGQMIGLEYPAGPKIEELAKSGDENRFKFTKPLIDNTGKKRDESLKYNFSFSGLKTAIRKELEKMTESDFSYSLIKEKLTDQDVKDISASFQKTIVDILKDRLNNIFKIINKDIKQVIIAGGVSANQYIKNNLLMICHRHNCDLITPDLKLCTDNGVMVAWAGYERYTEGLINALDTAPLARWEL